MPEAGSIICMPEAESTACKQEAGSIVCMPEAERTACMEEMRRVI